MDSHFDVIILGTGLTESVVAASLSKAGFKVAHIDENTYYGADDASLSLDELIKWADERSDSPLQNESRSSRYMAAQRSRFTSVTRTAPISLDSRRYSLSLSPSVIPAVGPLTASLISSGVSRYGSFRLLGRVGIYDRSGKVKAVPESKEHIFKSKEISLLDKRRLMRFLMFAASEFESKEELTGKEEVPFYEFIQSTFSLDDEAARAIVFALSHCVSTSDTTLPALRRLRGYLRSAGRYGASPFLIGYYGGAGEIAQGFCRASAVSGGVYILGKQISSIVQSEESISSHEPLGPERSPTYKLTLDDFPDPLICKLIISSQDYVPSLESTAGIARISPSPDTGDLMVARCIAIIDQPISFVSATERSLYDPDVTDTREESFQEFETSLLIFPPSSLNGGSSSVSVSILVTGEDSMSAPKGRWILYISMPVFDSAVSAESLLKPYLDAALALPSRAHFPPAKALFTSFYTQQRHSSNLSLTSSPESRFFVTPSSSHLPTEVVDTAVVNAEAAFWRAVAILKPHSTDFQAQQSGKELPEQFESIASFWPALHSGLDEEPDEL